MRVFHDAQQESMACPRNERSGGLGTIELRVSLLPLMDAMLCFDASTKKEVC